MITRKAAIGFILLAALVFPTAYISWVAPMPQIDRTAIKLNMSEYHVNEGSGAKSYVYHTPKVLFDSPLEMAVVVTVAMELFAGVCYMGLKRIEPYVIAWENGQREWVREKLE